MMIDPSFEILGSGTPPIITAFDALSEVAQFVAIRKVFLLDLLFQFLNSRRLFAQESIPGEKIVALCIVGMPLDRIEGI